MFDDVYLEDIESVVPYAEAHKLVFQVRAVCYSDDCYYSINPRPKRGGHRSDKGVLKTVSRTTSFCPDCEYALFWERYVA